MTRKFLQYFINGLLILLPVFIIGYVVFRLFVFIDDLIGPMLEALFGLDRDHRVPGLGFVLVLGIITLMGFLATTFIAKPIMRWFSRLLDRIPLLRTIYNAITDLLSAFVGKKKSFSQPVMVRLSKDTDVHKIGFITDENLEQLGEIEGKVAVYFPHSYNFSGNLFIVPREHVTLIKKNPADVMKYIVSGGVSDMDRDDEGKAL